MKRRPSRREIQAALVPALIEALDGLHMVEDGTTLLRTVRALTEIAFDLAAAAGDCPQEAMVAELARVARRRLRDLKRPMPIWLMREGKA